MKLIRAFLVALTASSVDASRVFQSAKTTEEGTEQVEEVSVADANETNKDWSTLYQSHGLPAGWRSSQTNPEGRGGWPTDRGTYYWKDGGDPQWSYPTADGKPTYDYYTGTHAYNYHYYSGSTTTTTTTTTTTMNRCGFPQKEAQWLLLVVMKNPDDMSVWIKEIKKFVLHCFEENSLMSSDFQNLLKDYGWLDLPPHPPGSYSGRRQYAKKQQNQHRNFLIPSFKKELKSFADTGAKRQVENVGCSEVPGSQEKKGRCVCIKRGNVIKGFAPHCRVKNVRTFSAKDFLRCVCNPKNFFVSGPCTDFGAPTIRGNFGVTTMYDDWSCKTRQLDTR